MWVGAPEGCKQASPCLGLAVNSLWLEPGGPFLGI